MITDEEIEQLPEDPELAFFQFEEIVRKRLNVKIDDLNHRRLCQVPTVFTSIHQPGVGGGVSAQNRRHERLGTAVC